MKSLAILSSLLVTIGPALADPYCDALLDPAQLEKRYQRLAPIFNNTDTGWIFTSDQLDADYEMSSETLMLMRGIVDAVEAQGATLAILTAPPRPVVAGQAILDATIGNTGIFDVNATRSSFDVMIDQLRAAGATVPNLQEVALGTNAEPFYFQRDTHWTTAGAAQSALTLAAELGLPAQFSMDDLRRAETFEERGSLSDIVEASCGLRDAPELVPVYDYSFSTEGLGLLGESATDQRQVTLLGTSFSNRYRRDQYQVADALSAALDANVENLSISGGGLIGPIEEFVLSGALQSEGREVIVWEFPYTEGLNTSPLRQLLGALAGQSAAVVEEQVLSVADDAVSFRVNETLQAANVLQITLDTVEAKQIFVDLTFVDGAEKTIKLRRKSAMQEVAQHAEWYAFIGGYKYGAVTSVDVRIDPKAEAQSAHIALLGSALN